MVYRYGVLPSQGVWFRREQEGAARRAGGGISRRQFAKLGAAAAAAAAIGTTGMFAYFTDEDSKANDLSVSPDLDIEVVEPSWVEEDARDMEPGQTVPKDPAVRNKSASAEGWVFLEVHVPMAEVVVYDPAAGTVSDASAKELFSYEADLSRWYLLKSFEALEGGVRTKVYRYAWPDVLAPGETTDPVFSEITLANLVNDQGQAGEHVVTAVGRGIQSYGFSTPEEAWAALGIVDDEYDGAKRVALTVALSASGATGKKVVLTSEASSPSVGEALPDGSGTVSEVACDIERIAPGATASPLTSAPGDIVKVECDTSVSPESMDAWFKGMASVESVDLRGVDVAGAKTKEELFEGCENLTEVFLDGPDALGDAAGQLPEGLTWSDARGAYVLTGKPGAYIAQGASATTLVFCDAAELPSVGDASARGTVAAVYEDVNGLASTETETRWVREAIAVPVSPFAAGGVDVGMVTAVVTEAWVTPASMRGWFAGFSGVETIDMAKFDLSACESWEGVMRDCRKLASVEFPARMGDGAPLSSMAWAFLGTGSLRAADLSWMSLGNVESFKGAFAESGVSSVNMAGADTGSATDMSYMFYCACNLPGVDVSSFDTSNVTSMKRMFSGDMIPLDEALDDILPMAIETLDLSGFDISKVGDMSYMCYLCSSMTSAKLPRSVSRVPMTMCSLFADCEALSSVDFTGFGADACTDISSAFGRTAIGSLDVSRIKTSGCSDFSWAFACPASSAIGLDGIDTSNATDMKYMLAGVKATLDLSAFDTSKARRMTGVLSGYEGGDIDVSMWDLSSVGCGPDYTDAMFAGAPARSIKLPTDASRMPEQWMDIRRMFEGCGNVEELDLTGLNMMPEPGWSWECLTQAAFNGCGSLRRIYVRPGTDLTRTSEAGYSYPCFVMFEGCTSLAGGAGTAFDPTPSGWADGVFDQDLHGGDAVDFALVDGLGGKPGYFTAKE